MKKINWLLMIVLLFSCSSENKNNKDDSPNHSILLDLNVDGEGFKIPSQLGDERYILLETKQNNSISSVDKLQFFNDQIFILDEQQNKLFIFDDNGLFVEQIDHKGNGPNEYLYLSDFLISEQDSCIELLDAGSKKILQLDRERQVKKTITVPVFCKKFLKNNQGEYFFFTNNQSNSDPEGGKSYNFIQTDKEGNEMNRLLSIPDEKKDLIIGEPYSFTSYEEGAVFSLPIDNHIYHLHNDSVYINYTISFGRFNTPETILARLKNVNDQDRIQIQMETFNDIVKRGYAYSIHSVLENEIFLFFGLEKEKACTQFSIIRKLNEF